MQRGPLKSYSPPADSRPDKNGSSARRSARVRSPLPGLLMETFGATAGCTVCPSLSVPAVRRSHMYRYRRSIQGRVQLKRPRGRLGRPRYNRSCRRQGMGWPSVGRGRDSGTRAGRPGERGFAAGPRGRFESTGTERCLERSRCDSSQLFKVIS